MAKRTRRTPEQKIKDLQAEIERIKERAARAQAKNDPALKQVTAAVRAIDKARIATEDKQILAALAEARGVLAGCLDAAGSGVRPATLTPHRSETHIEPEQVIAYLADHPASSGEEVARALGCDTKTLRPTMKQLIEDRRVKTKGKARGMRYTAIRA